MILQGNDRPGVKRSSAWVRLFAVNVTAGVALGFVMAAAIVITDMKGIGTLLRGSDQALVAAVLLTAGFAALAAAGAVSTAIMSMGEEPSGMGGRGLPGMLSGARPALRPIPVRARSRR